MGSPQRPPKRARAASAARPYHHGDLRQALIDAAIDLLREQGAEALTLRGVARAAGVSQTAPYRHFRDRRELVGAVAHQGFERMAAAIERSVQEGEAGLAGLRRGLAAYVGFARDHPDEYRVMFGAELADRDDMPELAGAAVGAFGFLREGITRLQQGGAIGAGDPVLMAITVWATLHGLVMLSLDGQTDVTGRSVDTIVHAASDLLIAGMRAAPR